MLKETYHPNAYLERVKNIKRGLSARTKILSVLENHSCDAKAAAKETGMAYGVVMHHLKLLAAEGIVSRKGDRPYCWTMTGFGQKRLAISH